MKDPFFALFYWMPCCCWYSVKKRMPWAILLQKMASVRSRIQIFFSRTLNCLIIRVFFYSYRLHKKPMPYFWGILYGITEFLRIAYRTEEAQISLRIFFLYRNKSVKLKRNKFYTFMGGLLCFLFLFFTDALAFFPLKA